MNNNLMKRAERLDNLRSMGISEKLTVEEANNIVTIWGTYLEHSGVVRYLFGINMPESFLPYPIGILQGALNKMEEYYFKQGHHDRVKLLEEREALLMQYTSDEEAIEEANSHFGDEKWRKVFVTGLKDYQKEQAQNGYLVDKKLWKLSKARIEELEG